MIDTLKIATGRIVMLERGRVYSVRRGKGASTYKYREPGPGNTILFETAKGTERQFALASITSIKMPGPKKPKAKQ